MRTFFKRTVQSAVGLTYDPSVVYISYAQVNFTRGWFSTGEAIIIK